MNAMPKSMWLNKWYDATPEPPEGASIKYIRADVAAAQLAEREKAILGLRDALQKASADNAVINDMAAMAQECRDDAIERIAELRAELATVLDVAIARGEQLGYEDEDYNARLTELQEDGR